MIPKFSTNLASYAALLSSALLVASCATPSVAGPSRSNANAPAAVSTSTPASALPADSAPRSSTQGAPAERTSGTVLDVAKNAGQFSTLVAAINAAGLSETLSGAGPFTVFAPTDAAFAKLPAGTVESLLMPENKAKLTALLSYHVVAGRVSAADLRGVTATPATVQGGTLSVDTSSGVKINGANVTTADVAASNGTIHVIDTVLIPPAN